MTFQCIFRLHDAHLGCIWHDIDLFVPPRGPLPFCSGCKATEGFRFEKARAIGERCSQGTENIHILAKCLQTVTFPSISVIGQFATKGAGQLFCGSFQLEDR